MISSSPRTSPPQADGSSLLFCFSFSVLKPMSCQDTLYRNVDPRTLARRWFLQQCGVGLGAMSLGQLIGSPVQAAPTSNDNPLAPRQPQFPGKAKSVIYLFMA